MNKILDQLFSMLKNTEMNTIEEIIKGRNDSNLKDSVCRRKKSWNEVEEPEPT